MSYYQAGDYYQGDNYNRAGDFLGIGRALKKFQPLKALGGLIRSTPIGALASSLVPGISNNNQRPMIIAPHGAPEPGVSGAIHRALPGGSSGYGYYNKDGEFIEGRRPRMNVGNIKALKRANRRAHGFLRVYKSAVRYFVPKSPKGKAYVSFRKKRK